MQTQSDERRVNISHLESYLVAPKCLAEQRHRTRQLKHSLENFCFWHVYYIEAEAQRSQITYSRTHSQVKLTPKLEPCSPNCIQVSSYFQIAFSVFETLIYQICKWVKECF